MYRFALREHVRLFGCFLMLVVAVVAAAGCTMPGAPSTSPTPPLQGQQQII